MGKGSRPTAEQVAWVFERLAEHLEEGGSFRDLIYDRMGFEGDAYNKLLAAGGHEIASVLDWHASRGDIEVEFLDDEEPPN